MPDPKHVVFSLYPEGVERTIGTWGASTVGAWFLLGSTVDQPMVYHVPSHALKNVWEQEAFLRDYFASTLEAHIKKYGPIDELVIGGHGSHQAMGGAKSGGAHLLAMDALEQIALLEEKRGCNLVKRIVFSGCGVFSGLSNRSIQEYRNFASKHGMQIVGSTSFTGSTAFGRYVQFSPDNHIVLDKELNSWFNPLALIDSDHSWVDFFIGRTQAEGEQARFAHAVSEMKKFVANYAHTSDNSQPDQAFAQLQKVSMDYWISDDWSKAVIADDAGRITLIGGTSLHRMSKEEEKRINIQWSGNMPIATTTHKPHFHMAQVLQKDRKHLLVVTDDAYAMIDVSAGETHVPLPSKNKLPSSGVKK